MATVRSVIGSFTGSMGGVTFSKWKDKDVAKQKVPANNTSNTPAQSAQRSKFAVLAQLGGQLGDAVRVGFNMLATSSTEQNVFQSRNKAAVSYIGGVATITYPSIQVSAGNVPTVVISTASYSAATGEMAVEWTDNSDGNQAREGDQLYVALYDKVQNKAYIYPAVATRADGQAIVTIGPGHVGANMIAYFFLKREDSMNTSNTIVNAF